jgi:hypothetical protein
MRQFRGDFAERFKKPKIKTETDKAYLFVLNNEDEVWIPKKWIKSFNKKDNTISVSEYWAMELKVKGFKMKK